MRGGAGVGWSVGAADSQFFILVFFFSFPAAANGTRSSVLFALPSAGRARARAAGVFFFFSRRSRSPRVCGWLVGRSGSSRFICGGAGAGAVAVIVRQERPKTRCVFCLCACVCVFVDMAHSPVCARLLACDQIRSVRGTPHASSVLVSPARIISISLCRVFFFLWRRASIDKKKSFRFDRSAGHADGHTKDPNQNQKRNKTKGRMAVDGWPAPPAGVRARGDWDWDWDCDWELSLGSEASSDGCGRR